MAIQFVIGKPEVSRDKPLHLWLEHEGESVALMAQRAGTGAWYVLEILPNGRIQRSVRVPSELGLLVDKNGCVQMNDE